MMDDHPFFKRKYAKVYEAVERRKQERIFLHRRLEPSDEEVLADLQAKWGIAAGAYSGGLTDCI